MVFIKSFHPLGYAVSIGCNLKTLNPEPGTDQLRMLNPQRRRDIRIRQRKKRGSLAATGDVELDPGFNYDGKYLMSNGNSLIL